MRNLMVIFQLLQTTRLIWSLTCYQSYRPFGIVQPQLSLALETMFKSNKQGSSCQALEEESCIQLEMTFDEGSSAYAHGCAREETVIGLLKGHYSAFAKPEGKDTIGCRHKRKMTYQQGTVSFCSCSDRDNCNGANSSNKLQNSMILMTVTCLLTWILSV